MTNKKKNYWQKSLKDIFKKRVILLLVHVSQGKKCWGSNHNNLSFSCVQILYHATDYWLLITFTREQR